MDNYLFEIVFSEVFIKLIHNSQEDQEHLSRNHSSISRSGSISVVLGSEFGRSSDDGKGVEGLIMVDEIRLVRVHIRDEGYHAAEIVGLIKDSIDDFSSKG